MERLDKGERVSKISVVALFLIGIAKGIIGLTSGSVSLVAQAVDSIKDIISLIAVIIGLRISKREPSERFTYGYYKIETIVSLIVSILIILTGGEILRESILQILNPKPISSPLTAVAIAAASIPLIYWLHKNTKQVAEEINSQSLRSQASDFMVDIYASTLVLIGVTSATIGYPSIEGLAGSIISLLVIKMGLSLTWNSVLGLMDAVEKPERLIKIKEVAESIKGVRKAYDIRLRNTGAFCMGELSIGVDKELNVDQAHRLSEAVETKIRNALPDIESITVHIEPVEEKTRVVAIPIEEDRGIDSTVSMHLGEAPLFLFVQIEDHEINRWFSKPNTSRELERRKGLNLAKMLIDEDITTLLVANLSGVIFHVLRDNFVQIYRIEEKTTARELINDLLEERLEIIDETGVVHEV